MAETDKRKITRCPGCSGTKKVIGLGMMSSNCDQCKGVGFIYQDEEKKEVEVSKPRGRPRSNDKQESKNI